MEPPPPLPDMDFSSAVLDDPSSALWDWGDLLDFTLDDQFPNPLSSPPPPPPPHEQDRVRKRDPRLTCSNFLAGRIPCACPELDEMLKEEEAQKQSGGPAKKRSRTVRPSVGKARCQVPGCEADISELKGYHRRHRVCLRCANASLVVIDGESKRYCQQCGKFHVLPDFDEGKRSCRRKLERHNNRRRRKSVDSKGAVESLPAELVVCDDGDDEEAEKGSLFLSSQIAEKEALVESGGGQMSTLCSAPDSKNSDSVASFGPSGETQVDVQKDNINNSVSGSNWDSKNTYSSVCPTGRISFKLYDWNPAEFPRRLRQQIFQWLGSMPVELEGYIRPGCIILTVFVAMPKLMWVKLSEHPVSYVQNLVVAPGSLLSGKGNMFVYLNNMALQVMKNGTSMMEVQVEVPRLHYVHPICFEAGKPMEFVACGNNLLQPKLRFLISFADKYMECDYCVASPCGEIEGGATCISRHQLYKINIPRTEPNLFGPAFIEVENESGLSNFIPVLIARKEICSEMQILQQRLDGSLTSQGSQFAYIDSLSISCEISGMRQTMISEFILDLAWLLKKPTLEKYQRTTTSSQIQRLTCLLQFLIQHELTYTLEKILQNLNILIDNKELKNAVDMSPLLTYIDCAKDIIDKKLKDSSLVPPPGRTKPERDCVSQKYPQIDRLSGVPVVIQDVNMQTNGKLEPMVGLASSDRSETVPLLSREFVMNMNHIKEWPRKSCGRVVSRSVLSSRVTMFVIATVAICVGICAVVLHPNKVSEFAVSIRRCLFDKF